jgi:hypothetical protein
MQINFDNDGDREKYNDMLLMLADLERVMKASYNSARNPEFLKAVKDIRETREFFVKAYTKA